jgi:hypothetical protein
MRLTNCLLVIKIGGYCVIVFDSFLTVKAGND